MADSTPERSAYLPPHARSQTSNNWRTPDATPRADPPQRKPNNGGNDSSSDAGNRLYVGNLLYTASREDVEQLFTANGFALSGISMTVDPFTQRNPSYAFVDLDSPEEAARALEQMQGKELLGREIRVNPGVRRQPGTGERRVRNFADGSFQQDRVGDGNTSPASNRWNRTDSAQNSANAQSQGLRLYVGGLPRIEPQSACEETVRAMFNSAGIEVAAVSKIISPHPSKTEEPGNHHYCFVDMNSNDDVDVAVEKLNGAETEWGMLRVGRAKDNSTRQPARGGYERREQDGGGYERRERGGGGYERRERDGGRVEERSSWR